MIVVDWSLQRLKEKLFILNKIRCVIENWLQYRLFLSNDLFLPNVNIGFLFSMVWFLYILVHEKWKLLPSLFLLDTLSVSLYIVKTLYIRSYLRSFLSCKYDFLFYFHLVTNINIATRGEEELLQGGIWFSPDISNVWGDISHSRSGHYKGISQTKKGLKKKNYKK